MHPIVDTDLLTARKLRAKRSAVAGADFLMRRAADDLAERLSTTPRRFPRAVLIGTVTEAARQALLASGKVDEIVEVAAHRDLLGASDSVVAAAETVPLPAASFDLAVSLMSLHEMNDLPGMLIQICRVLKPDGLFLAAMAGGGTLAELRESLLAAETELSGGASPRVLPFTDVRDAGALLQRAGFALPVADLETITVRYESMFGLMRDLRSMGQTNPLLARSRVPARRALFLRAAEIYAERFADPDGRVRATFAMVWLSGWAPDQSQQKALRPGSARVSLASVLKDVETGED